MTALAGILAGLALGFLASAAMVLWGERPLFRTRNESAASVPPPAAHCQS